MESKIADNIDRTVYNLCVRLSVEMKIFQNLREHETNVEWSEKSKKKATKIISSAFRELEFYLNCPIFIVDMPYTAPTGSGRGVGKNPLNVSRAHDIFEYKPLPVMGDPVYCLIDIIDGTWNFVSGFPYSCSTTLAMTQPTNHSPEELRLVDFQSAYIIPYYGHGLYMAKVWQGAYFIDWKEQQWKLSLNLNEIVGQCRCILDLFTEEKSESLRKSVSVIGGLYEDWSDVGRLYGAGIETTTLLGYNGVTPGFSAHVSANQKMDNVIPLHLMISEAGGIVTDWWGRSLMDCHLPDRPYVLAAANTTLHQNLRSHLSQREII